MIVITYMQGTTMEHAKSVDHLHTIHANTGNISLIDLSVIFMQYLPGEHEDQHISCKGIKVAAFFFCSGLYYMISATTGFK